MVGYEVQRDHAKVRHVAADVFQQGARKAMAAMLGLNVQGADVWSEVAPLVEVVFNDAYAACNLFAVERYVPLRYGSAARLCSSSCC